MKLLKIILMSSLITGLVILLYGIINWVTFLNLIEAPLPEGEEKIPDLELVPE